MADATNPMNPGTNGSFSTSNTGSAGQFSAPGQPLNANGSMSAGASPMPSNPAGAAPMGAAPGGTSPMGGATGSGMPGSGTPPTPPAEDNTPANFMIGQKLPKVISIIVPPHSLQFDEQYFLHLLAGSISLTKDEKKRIVESIPKLKQSQVDELIRIFEEERRKFAELSAKHVEQLKKLDQQHYDDWMDLELAQKADAKKNDDQSKAEEIRKSLGL